MISEKYGIANGVKQGGVLSPILFDIYMDNLIKRLKDSNIGCKIGNKLCRSILLCRRFNFVKSNIDWTEMYAYYL